MTLFNDSEVFQKARPTESDITDEQKAEFYQKAAHEIIHNRWSTDDDESIIEALQEISCLDDSGYEIAKQLEDGYGRFEFEVGFIEYLDGLGSDYRDITRKNIKVWVEATKPMPKLEIGQAVRFEKPIFSKMDVSKDHYITKIDPVYATYCINEVKENYGGYIFPYEKIESLNIHS